MTEPTLAERIVEAWEDTPDWANETKAQVAIDLALEEAAQWHDYQVKLVVSALSKMTHAKMIHEDSATAIRAVKEKP